MSENIETTDIRRRRLLLAGVAVGLSAPLLMSWSSQARAQALKRLNLENATAKALFYVEDAKASSHAKFVAGSNCANCQFIQGANGAAYRPCQLFPGYEVASAGWCTAWAKKSGA